MIDVADIVRHVGDVAFDRARGYVRSGAVENCDWDGEASVLRGVVQGNAAAPYRCRIHVETSAGRARPVSSSCSCPAGSGCQHVAATLLHSNAGRLRRWGDASGQAPAPAASAASATSAPPAWKTALATLVDDGASDERTGRRGDAGASLSGTVGGEESPTSPMGLQFELLDKPAASPRRGPTSASGPAHAGGPRLGVRPMLRNARGTWVKGKLSWNTINYQMHRMRLEPQQHRWFCQFAPLYRANGLVYFGSDNEWLFLDEFSSPLLWNLLDEAQRLGIALIGSRKHVTVTVGREARVSLDATTEARDDAGSVRLRPRLLIDGVAQPIGSAAAIGTHGLYCVRTGDGTDIILAPTPRPLTDRQRRVLASGTDVVVPDADVAEFMDAYYPRLRRAIEVASSDDSVPLPEIEPPTLILAALYDEDRLTLDWRFAYGHGPDAVEIPIAGQAPIAGQVPNYGQAPDPGSAADADAANIRDPETEAGLLAAAGHVLENTGWEEASLYRTSTLTGMGTVDFTQLTLPALEALDRVRVEITGERPDYRELTETPELTVSTVDTDDPDWFSLGVMVTVSGRSIPFDHLFSALSRGRDRLLLPDKSYLSLRRPQFDTLRRLIEEAKELSEWESGAVKISRYQHGLWADFEDLADETDEARTWRASVSELRGLDRIASTPLPAGIDARLRPYQRDGFTWLAFLHRHGLGGVLADDMGLGKTLQTLALMQHAKDTGQAHHPFLVVAPTSVVSNWAAETARFAPDLTTAVVTESFRRGRASLPQRLAGADVVVTSYTLFRLDFADYERQPWAGLILDEAQFVKNRSTRAHQCAKSLPAPFKLAITGTPMENSLMDLWSMFSIVAPGLFPSARRFTEEYRRPIERGGDTERLARLRRRIRPLLLRRTKEAVAPELPARQEQVLHVQLVPRHRKIYRTYLQRERQKILGLLEDMDKNRMIVFRSLTLLRMLSLDASLLDDEYDAVPSAKLDALLEQLEDVATEGHRALVFSQFTSFLAKAATRLDAAGIDYAYLDGSTRRRGDVIDTFKAGDAPVFLISLKAGGFGLNLTEADYCFLLDPWWNPAAEDQAVDRTHRIGQDKNVMVYRLVAEDTIEEKVMALKEKKAKLTSSVLDDDATFAAQLTADDIHGLFE